MKRFGLTLSAVLLAAGFQAGPVSAQGKAELVTVQTGGFVRTVFDKYMYGPFAKLTGIEVVPVDMEIPDQWARIDAMLRTGKVEYDLVSSTDPDFVERADMLYKIDCNALPNFVKNGLPGSCQEFGVIRTIGTQMLIYDKDVFAEGPKNWADFWDQKKFPGARAFPDTTDRDWWLPAIALMADGVKPEDLWPLDLDRAYKKLDEIRPYVTVWWKNGNQMQQAMRSKEVVMLVGFSGRALAANKEGMKWGMVWENNLPSNGWMSIMKASPNIKSALAFLDFFYGESEGSTEFMRELHYGTGNKSALERMPPEEQIMYASHPDNYNKIIKADYKWIGENRTMLRERWNTWHAR